MTELTIAEARKALLDLPEKLARTPERAVTITRRGPPGSSSPAPASSHGPDGSPYFSRNELGPPLLSSVPEFVHHPEEAPATLLPLLELPDRHDGGHGLTIAFDHVLVTLVVDPLEELAEILSDFQGATFRTIDSLPHAPHDHTHSTRPSGLAGSRGRVLVALYQSLDIGAPCDAA